MRYDPHEYEAAGIDPEERPEAVIVWGLIAIGFWIGLGILAWALWRVAVALVG